MQLLLLKLRLRAHTNLLLAVFAFFDKTKERRKLISIDSTKLKLNPKCILLIVKIKNI